MMNLRHLTTKTSVSLLLISVCLNIYLLLDKLGSTASNVQSRAVQVNKRSNKGVVAASQKSYSPEADSEPVPINVPSLSDNDKISENVAVALDLLHNKRILLKPTAVENNNGQDRPTHHMLAVAVMSSPGNIDARNAIRMTWKNGYENRDYFVKFVVGKKGLDLAIIDSLERENHIYNDIILLDMRDSYRNLAHKVLATLVWFDQNVNYSYLLKCDDDTFPMLDHLEDQLMEREHRRGLYWGYFLPFSPPVKEGRWAETNWKFCDQYFPYAAGGGYVLSADVIHRIASNADALIVYNNEDVSVGAWTVSYDIERKHDVRFDTETFSRGCNSSFLVFHKQMIKDILEKDALYRKSRRLCKREFLRVEFEYDWKQLPSRAHKQTCCLVGFNYGWVYRILLLCIGVFLILVMWKVVLDKHLSQ